jgi:hypothetical protein
MRLASRALALSIGLLAATPAVAFAHGVQGKADTPIPISAFFYAAGAVLIASFLGLGVGWSKARFTTFSWWPARPWLQRLVRSQLTLWALRLLVLACFVLVVIAAAFGSTELNANIAPVTIFVFWWVGLVPLSVALGNVWREANPWSTIARLVRMPDVRERALPRGIGLWPAVGSLVCFAWLELVYPTAAHPRLIAGLAIAYTLLTLTGMWVYGRERWLDHGEVFSVYTGTLARLSPVEMRDGWLGFRLPLVGATGIRWQPAQIAFIGVLIGTVTFDGLSGSELWATRDVAAADRLVTLGLDSFTAGLVVASIGLVLTLLLVIGAYELAAFISGRTAGWARLREGGRSAIAFVHSLIPIALAYFVAHYFSLFVFQSQDIIRLASDPLGTGSDLLGTADYAIDFTLVSANMIWAVQVGAIIVGHVAGLILAHDRALELSGNRHRLAMRSQYPMLILMVMLTVAGLWSLSQGMATE